VFCPVEGCVHRTPYKIPGFLVNHLINNHSDQFQSKEHAKARVDVLFAQEMQTTLTRGTQPTIIHENVAYEELEDGELEEIEEMSGTVFGATLPLIGVQPEEPLAIPQLHAPPPHQPGTIRRRSASVPTRADQTPSPPASPKNNIRFPGLAVTVIIYDLETTG